MTEAEAATIRACLDWLTNRSPDYYVCEAGPGYEHPDYIPLRDDDGGVARLMADYAAWRDTPPEPPPVPFADSMMGRSFAASMWAGYLPKLPRDPDGGILGSM